MKKIENIASIYNRYVDDLYTYAIYLGFEKEMVMDAIHDVFCKFAADEKILQDVSNVKFYLFKSLKNRLYDIYKTRKEYIGLSTIDTQVVLFNIHVTIEDRDMAMGGGQSELALRGGFYRINYDYQGKYLFETNGRYDGTSRFPRGDRFGFFPSVSAGWRISEELFWKPIRPVVDNLKLRASYGTLGNQATGGRYMYIPSLTGGTLNYILDGERARYINQSGAIS